MARLPIQNPQTATGSNKEIFDFLQKALGTVPNMAKVMGNSPALLQGFAGLNGALGHAKLSGTIRESIAMLVAEQNHCTYCLSAHTVLGGMAGLKPDQIVGARTGASNEPRTRAALAFAKAVLTTSGGVSDSDFASVRAAGFSDAEIAEIVGVVALNVLTNFFNRAFDVDVDFPHVQALAR